MAPSLSQALHLLNGNTINNKVPNKKLIHKWLKEDKLAHADVIEKLYLRCLGRAPTEAEKAALLQNVEEEENKKQALEDVFWALLNSREFVFNH